jgi:hypothetical protein
VLAAELPLVTRSMAVMLLALKLLLAAQPAPAGQ